MYKMKTFKLGKTGIDVSAVALGCWVFGGGYWGDYENDAVSLKTIDTALDLGINFFDTAEVYGNDGHADVVLGRAMKGRRDRFVVSTKVFYDKLGSQDLVNSCENSLKRLGTDYIDLFSPHFPSKTIPFEETFDALEKLKREGKIRAIGLCNFGADSLRKLEDMGRIRDIELHQLPYSLLWRAIEYEIQEKTVEAGLGIICYSTLAQGLLSGAFDTVDQVPDNLKVSRLYNCRHINAGHGEVGCEDEVFSSIREIKALCAEAGLELAPACLAWLFKRKGVSAILTGPRNPGELMENIRALDISIPDELEAKMAAATDKVKAKIGSNADMWVSGDNSRIY
jgi:myo-inositol catabolism protein IolS